MRGEAGEGGGVASRAPHAPLPVRGGRRGAGARPARGLDSAIAKIRYQKEYKDLTVVRYVTYNLCSNLYKRGVLTSVQNMELHFGLS